MCMRPQAGTLATHGSSMDEHWCRVSLSFSLSHIYIFDIKRIKNWPQEWWNYTCVRHHRHYPPNKKERKKERKQVKAGKWGQGCHVVGSSCMRPWIHSLEPHYGNEKVTMLRCLVRADSALWCQHRGVGAWETLPFTVPCGQGGVFEQASEWFRAGFNGISLAAAHRLLQMESLGFGGHFSPLHVRLESGVKGLYIQCLLYFHPGHQRPTEWKISSGKSENARHDPSLCRKETVLVLFVFLARYLQGMKAKAFS